jgi:serine/threonine protein kinase/formylglycine-generating enzyme required for sulfatase activity
MPTPSSPFDPRVEELFLEFLRRRDVGAEPDLESLCQAHPQHAKQLRQLLAAYDAASRLRPRADEMPLAERLKRQFGEGVDPGVSLGGEPRADSEPQSKLFERLRSEGPRGTRYKLLGEVERGGMGAILKIWDEELRRTLAMKVVLGRGEQATGETPAVDPKTLGRFLEEAQITGQLDHPGIVPVHELGLDATGRVYFTMKLVKGEDLRAVFEHVKSGHDGWNQVRALGVLLRVCEAMAFAHSKQVVHRDLKPANVMVGKFGEVYVMDWGLARVLGLADKHDVRLRPAGMSTASVVKTERHDDREGTPDSPLVTMDGDVVGTPSFMPPEQARGELDKLGPHSDVYSIGAMLYQLVTGEVPYVPAGTRVSQHTILLALLREPPPPIEKLAPATPPELVAICEKAMERDIAKRYATTLELAADLRAFLEGRVVRAYETGTWAETKKWVQRNKPLAASLAAATAILIGGIAITLAERSKTERANATLSTTVAALRAQSREQKLRGMIQDLARLRAQSRTLEGLDRLGKPAYLWWIEESEKLLSGQEEDLPAGVEWRPGLKDVRAKLAELRTSDQLLPYTDEDKRRDFESHPDRKLLRELEATLQDADTVPADKSRLEHEAEVVRTRCGERRMWRFRQSQVEWWHSLLVALESDLAWQAQMLEVATQAAWSETAKARWAEAIEGIAKSPEYAGQKWPSGERLTPQLGLLPLGENPATGLWEFVHLQTGTEPGLGADGRVLRDAEGRLTLTAETGMVLVLLPGGRVPKSTGGDAQEAWIPEIDLAPFFLSKYELTHEQWDRVSLRKGYSYTDGKALTPANNISCDDITLMLQRELGWCGFPSVAQWEYGCRARTSSRWWTGNEAKELVGVANIDHDDTDDTLSSDIERVGSLRANAFGLHDVHGNVWDWCGDTYDADAPPRDGDGLRDDGVDGSVFRVPRGGCWADPASRAWSAFHDGSSPMLRLLVLGVRPARRITP